MVDERGEPVEHVTVAAVDGLDLRQPGAPGERRKTREQGPCRRIEEVVAPLDRAAERALPVGQITGACREEVKGRAQPLQDRLGRKDLDARRGELDGERQAVEPRADLGDGARVRGRDAEVWLDRDCALDEEPHRLRLREHLGSRREVGERERRHRELPFAVHTQRRAAGRDDPDVRRRAQQLSNERSSRQELLEVVDDEQRRHVA